MVFFNIKDNFAGVRHRLLGVKKVLFKQPNTFYLDRLNRLGVNCKPVTTSADKDVVCHICGYSMANMALPGGWSLQACSAVNMERTATSSTFKKWAETLCDCNHPHPKEEAQTYLKGERPALPVLTASNLPITLLDNILS